MANLMVRVAVAGLLRRSRGNVAPLQVVLHQDFATLKCERHAPTKVVFAQPACTKLAPLCSRFLATASKKDDVPKDANATKLSLFQRFKQMYRDYWYVLVPVHLITSAGWFGSFYYMAKSGIDVVAIMESYNISSKITSPLKDSSLGYVAIAYAMYKIATPIRYTVTLGGTTISINYLQKWGYIKPVPTREQLKEMYNSKREIMMETVNDKREELRLKKEALKDRTDHLIGDVERKIVTKIQETKKKTTNTIEKQ